MPTVTSETAIANLALQKLGERAIMSLNDDEKSARELKLAFVPTRQSLLREYGFHFAIKRVQLSELVTPPVSTYANAFQLPDDFIRAISLNPDKRGKSSDAYDLESRSIVTDADTAILRYVADIEDVTKYDSLFVEAFACKLALRVCKTITGSDERQQILLKEFQALALPNASGVDAQEGREELQWFHGDSALDRSRRTSILG